MKPSSLLDFNAADDLSIQVHPDDTLAKARYNSCGQTGMCYMIQADELASCLTDQSVDPFPQRQQEPCNAYQKIAYRAVKMIRTANALMLKT